MYRKSTHLNSPSSEFQYSDLYIDLEWDASEIQSRSAQFKVLLERTFFYFALEEILLHPSCLQFRVTLTFDSCQSRRTSTKSLHILSVPFFLLIFFIIFSPFVVYVESCAMLELLVVHCVRMCMWGFVCLYMCMYMD